MHEARFQHLKPRQESRRSASPAVECENYIRTKETVWHNDGNMFHYGNQICRRFGPPLRPT